jgi:hypothetical protein
LNHVEKIESNEIVAACEDGSFAKVCAPKIESKGGSNGVYYLGGLVAVAAALMYFKRRGNSGSTKTVHGAKFARVKSDDEDVSPRVTATPSGESATEFVERVLAKLGIPGYGMAKYTSMLKDKHLHTMDQLRAMDDADWKGVGLPPVIENGLKEALTGRSAPSREVRSGGMELTRKPVPSRVERVDEVPKVRQTAIDVEEIAAGNPTDAWDLDMPDEDVPPSPTARDHVSSTKKSAMVIPEEKDPEAPSADSELTSDKPVAPKNRPKTNKLAAGAKPKPNQKKGLNEVQEEGEGWMDMDDF